MNEAIKMKFRSPFSERKVDILVAVTLFPIQIGFMGVSSELLNVKTNSVKSYFKGVSKV